MGALRSRACLGAPQRRDVVKQAARRVLRQYPFQTRQKDFPRLYLVPQPQCASHAFAVGGQLLLEDADADAYLIGLCSKCCLDWPSTLHAELDLPWKRISNLRDMLWFLGIASYFPTRDSRSRPAARMSAPLQLEPSQRIGVSRCRRHFQFGGMAEREGFEPPMGLHPCRISSAVHSTTLPPLRGHGRPLPARRTR